HLAAVAAKRRHHAGQEARRDLFVHEQVLDCVADARPLHLRVETDALGHGEVGGGVDIEVTDALEVLDYRDAALLEDGTLQLLAAAGDYDVDPIVAGEQSADQ